MSGPIEDKIERLKNQVDGDVFDDRYHQIMYATDASVFKEMPMAVAVPRNKEDIKQLIDFSRREKIPLIPRGAGTSLAGQVVGNGIVIDNSKHLTHILELNKEERWVKVEPGVILDQLNAYLKPHGLFFSPETSTASRCTLGGMLGNNSCGLHSVIYGSMRDHILEVEAILSDGTETVFNSVTEEELVEKRQGDDLESRIYNKIFEIFSDKENQREIESEFPHKSLPRKNTGYALDVILDSSPFTPDAKPLNLAHLLAGSEGTLAFATAIKLNVIPLPPKEKALICAHFETLEDALLANIIALKFDPGAVELMDDEILKLTEGNILQTQNRVFVKGNPGAILIIEYTRETPEEIRAVAGYMEAAIRGAGLGYHFPIIFGEGDISKVWDLRRSALGLLSNMPGDAKPVTVIEDTAVSPQALPEYIADVKKLLKSHGLSCVFSAHVGSGEIHLRPVLNLKDENDVKRYRTIATEMAHLVKKHKGALSGEHGDGRLRGEFIPIVIGEKNYQLLREIKSTWDPDKIFNPGKIVDTPKMDSHLRYEPGHITPNLNSCFDFSASLGMMRAIEKCNGSANCKNTAETGSQMCPSYQASLDESKTTRARANIMREFISQSGTFDHREILEVLDECLMCKGCKLDCPSTVDMAKLKAEFLQQFYDLHGPPVRSRMISNIGSINKLGSLFTPVFNLLFTNSLLSGLLKKMMGFASERSLPPLSRITLSKWIKKNLDFFNEQVEAPIKTVCLFVDEFTNFNDAEIGVKAIRLLSRLNYRVIVPQQRVSGRTFLSKGFVRQATSIINDNIKNLKNVVSENQPLIGIDPSAILTFRDEYLDLAAPELKESAKELSHSVFLIDEFLANEIEAGNIRQEQFSSSEMTIKFHGHCYQKTLSNTDCTQKILSFPENYTAEEIDSGCCGMAGVFGMEKKHYELSQKIAELKLLPAIRKADESIKIVAVGTSCRHQIADLAGRKAYHPVEILYDALANN